MKYAKRLNIVRRRLKIRKEHVNNDMHDFIQSLSLRLGLKGFARYVKNCLHIELEGTEILIQEFMQTCSTQFVVEGEPLGFDIEQLPLAGDDCFELKGIDIEN